MSNTVTVKTEIDKSQEGVYEVSLFDINNGHFKNYRKNVSDDYIEDLRLSIKQRGLLQDVVGAWLDDDENGSIGLIAGFCRFEAMQRIALWDLVKEYNKAHNLEGDDAIPHAGHCFRTQQLREKIREAGDEWKEKYDDALKAYKIRVKTRPIKDNVDAALDNMVENEVREDASLADKLSRIEDLINEGVKAKRIATALRTNEPGISQCRKIVALPAALREKFGKTGDGELDSTAVGEAYGLEGEAANEKADQLLLAVDEFQRRLDLPKNHDSCIKFSLARDLAAAVLHKKDPLSLRAAGDLLIELTRMDGKNPTSKSTMDFSEFKKKLADAKKKTNLPDEPEVEEGSGGAEGVTTEDVAADQVSSGKTDGSQEGDESIERQIKDENDAAVESGDAAPIEPSLEGESEEGEEEEESPEDEEAALDAEIEADIAEAESQDDESSAPAATPPPDGQISHTTKDAPEQSFKVMAPFTIEQRAHTSLDDAFDDESADTYVDRSQLLLVSTTLLEVVGKDRPSGKVNKAYVEYTELVNELFDEALKVVDEKGTKAQKSKVAEIREKLDGFERPSLVEGEEDIEDEEGEDSQE